MAKAHTATTPLAIGSHDIFGDKSNRSALTNQLVVIRVGLRCNQGDHCGAVWRRDSNPTLPGLKANIKGQIESKLIEIEPQASILIANEDIDRIDAEVATIAIVVLATLRQSRLIRQTERWGAGHGGYYKPRNIRY